MAWLWQPSCEKGFTQSPTRSNADSVPKDRTSPTHRLRMRLVFTKHRLVDALGEWCGWCVAYFESGQPRRPPSEANHLVLQAWTRQVHPAVSYTPRAFLRAWTVDVHQECHRGRASAWTFQDASDVLTFTIKRYYAPAVTIRDWQAIDLAARSAHEQGLYAASAVLKWRLAELRQADGWPAQEVARSRYLEVASLAGVAHRFPTKIGAVDTDLGGARLAYHLANYHSNRGRFEDAQRWLAMADDLRSRAGPAQFRELTVDLALRHEQIERTPAAAQLAVDVTRDGDPYRYNTALVLAAFGRLREGVHTAASALARQVLDTPGISWLYRAEALFILGCAELLSRGSTLRSDQRAYRLLVQAQYIYAILGLQGTPHRLPLELGAGVRNDATPSHVLITPRFWRLTRETCEVLRQEAVLDPPLVGLQDQLIALFGRWYPIADWISGD